MKRFRLLPIPLIALFLITLVGCDSSASPDISVSNDESIEETTESALTISDVRDVDGFYCLGSDGQSIENTNPLTYLYAAGTEDSLSFGEEYINEWESYKEGTSIQSSEDSPMLELYSSAEPTVVNRSDGERLIFISSDEYPSVFIEPVVYNGYSQAYGITGILDAYEEINGIDTSDTDALASMGIVHDTFSGGIVVNESERNSYYAIISETPQTFSAGWYEGTRWVDGQLSLTTPFYVSLGHGDSSSIELIGTRDGYMEVDISSLAPGLYIAYSFNPDAYIAFEVR